MKKRVLSIFLCLSVLLSLLTLASCSDKNDPPADKVESIAILYENDVHCAVEGYSKLAAMKSELKSSYDHVGVVSSGDFVQGGTLGAVSKGEYIINLMNKVGYDAIALGNHEFDYQLARLVELNNLSNTKFLSCNFAMVGEDKSYFDSYTIVSYGDVEIAYIGITTPSTISSSNPAQFKNEDGEIIYTFDEAEMYSLVQANIDAAEKAGADYVIALSHIGYSEAGDWSDITDEATAENATETVFEPYEPKIRKSGTGCVTMINDHLYEGRFTPRVNGKRISKNVYAKTREECEEKLAELIKTMKAEIAEMKKQENNA